MRLEGIPAHDLDLWLPHVRPFLEMMAQGSHGKFNVSHILDKLRERDWQLWIALDGQLIRSAGITTIAVYPTGLKVCEFIFCVGFDMDKWTHLLPLLEKFAKEKRCDRFEPICRPGWQRILKKYGYETTHLFLEKHL